MTSLLPYICADRAAEALDFYAEAFGAEEIYRLTLPDGTIPHAEIRIGDSLLMVCDEVPNEGVYGPKKLGGVSAQFTIDVADVDALDALWARATGTGVEVERELGRPVLWPPFRRPARSVRAPVDDLDGHRRGVAGGDAASPVEGDAASHATGATTHDAHGRVGAGSRLELRGASGRLACPGECVVTALGACGAPRLMSRGSWSRSRRSGSAAPKSART